MNLSYILLLCQTLFSFIALAEQLITLETFFIVQWFVLMLVAGIFLSSSIRSLQFDIDIENIVDLTHYRLLFFILCLPFVFLLASNYNELLGLIVQRELYSSNLVGSFNYGFLLIFIQIYVLLLCALRKDTHLVFIFTLLLSMLSGTRTAFIYFFLSYLLIYSNRQSGKNIIYISAVFSISLILFISYLRSLFFSKDFDLTGVYGYTVYPFANLEFVLNNVELHKAAINRLIDLKASASASYEDLHAPFRSIGKSYSNVYTMYADYVKMFGVVGTSLFLFWASFIINLLFRSTNVILKVFGSLMLPFFFMGFFNEKLLLSFSLYLKYPIYLIMLLTLINPIWVYGKKLKWR